MTELKKIQTHINDISDIQKDLKQIKVNERQFYDSLIVAIYKLFEKKEIQKFHINCSGHYYIAKEFRNIEWAFYDKRVLQVIIEGQKGLVSIPFEDINSLTFFISGKKFNIETPIT